MPLSSCCCKYCFSGSFIDFIQRIPSEESKPLGIYEIWYLNKFQFSCAIFHARAVYVYMWLIRWHSKLSGVYRTAGSKDSPKCCGSGHCFRSSGIWANQKNLCHSGHSLASDDWLRWYREAIFLCRDLNLAIVKLYKPLEDISCSQNTYAKAMNMYASEKTKHTEFNNSSLHGPCYSPNGYQATVK